MTTRTKRASPQDPAEPAPEIDQFLQELERQQLAHYTIENYASDLRVFARFFTGSTGEEFQASNITPTDIRDFKARQLTVEQRSPATINRRLASLRKFFLWAKAEGLIKEIPTDPVKGVQSTPLAPRSLEKREVDKLIRAVQKDENKRNLAILLTLRHTGIRIGELAALRLSDIEISERKGWLTIRSGKGSKHRAVPLNADARKAISDYLEIRPKIADDHLFISQRGQGLKEQAVELMVAKYAQAAGLEGVTPHQLRHSFGKHALDAGVDLVTVSKLLGHTRLDTTARYTTPSQKDLEKAVAKLEFDNIT
jgi:site-specific recombinase XerD